MVRVPVNTASASYEAVIEHGILSRAGEVLAALSAGIRPLFVVTVPRVRRRWGKTLRRSLEKAGFSARVIEMPDGERFKRLSTVETLAEEMVRLGADRKALVAAFGGGVACDVVGMLASVYMRGVGFVQIPTTVQAQLDAAIGGKTGVNLRAGKNLVGTFYQPELVLIDPAVLTTLPEREFRAGMYEAIKCGIIGNAELFDRLERSPVMALRKDVEFLTWTIAESVRLKAKVVSADEREGNLRRVLNLGHTLGHALEAATAYRRFLHGEAVAWGMHAAARIAFDLGCCDRAVYERIRGAVHAWGTLPAVNVQTPKALKLVRSDKKTEGGVVHFVLPKEIGRVEIVKDVPDQVVSRALAEIRRTSRG
ncbi:MAG TPA: 3-dehydroquinate synthase [Terriglobales bacterium]|nr:3-dehydroquinate synthase [Terriglobales bacterium]